MKTYNRTATVELKHNTSDMVITIKNLPYVWNPKHGDMDQVAIFAALDYASHHLGKQGFGAICAITSPAKGE
jgi:hypothetical protein|tara:strand:- start:262 stop:477 length:216 start_codon:yes stop_codon:yes gene_type:complete